MSFSTTISTRASLIADPARATMLSLLLDGRARPAGELAQAASITAQTASSHLAKLLAASFLECESQGRHRYYRSAGIDVAEALERLATMRPSDMRTPTVPRELRYARSCYDHLAGQLGVAVTTALRNREYIEPIATKQFAITIPGARWFTSMGIDVRQLRSPRGIARQCLDWTERVHHLGGPLGVQLLTALCERQWLRRAKASRRILVTALGATELKTQLGVMLPPASNNSG